MSSTNSLSIEVKLQQFEEQTKELVITQEEPKCRDLALEILIGFFPNRVYSLVGEYFGNRKLHILKYDRLNICDLLKNTQCSNKKHYEQIVLSCEELMFTRINEFFRTYFPNGKKVLQTICEDFPSETVITLDGNLIDRVSKDRYKLNLNSFFDVDNTVLTFDHTWERIEMMMGKLLCNAEGLPREETYEFISAFDTIKYSNWKFCLPCQAVLMLKPELFALALEICKQSRFIEIESTSRSKNKKFSILNFVRVVQKRELRHLFLVNPDVEKLNLIQLLAERT